MLYAKRSGFDTLMSISDMIDMDCLALGLTETHPSNRKACSDRLRSAVSLEPTPTLGTN